MSVISYDVAGNANKAETATTTADSSGTATVTGFTVKSHIISKETSTVTVTGSNLTALYSMKIRVYDSTGVTTKSTVDATIKNDTSATATITAPADTTAAGTTYTIKAIMFTDASTSTASTASTTFKVTAPAAVTNVLVGTNNAIKDSTGGSATVTITGTNFDIRGATYVKLLDSSKTVVATSEEIAASESDTTTISTSIKVPTTVGYYTAAVYFDNVAQSVTSTLHIYGDVSITNVKVPNATLAYAGQSLPVTDRKSVV